MTEAQHALLSAASRQRDGYVYPLFKRASTARAAVRKGWLAYQGAGGYRLTDDGRAVLAEAERNYPQPFGNETRGSPP